MGCRPQGRAMKPKAVLSLAQDSGIPKGGLLTQVQNFIVLR